MHEHGWSLTEIEGMTPLERDIYISMLSERMKEKAMEARHKQGGF